MGIGHWYIGVGNDNYEWLLEFVIKSQNLNTTKNWIRDLQSYPKGLTRTIKFGLNKFKASQIW